MQKQFLVKVSSTIIPDRALTENEVTQVIAELVYGIERQYGMGGVYIQVNEVSGEAITPDRYGHPIY